VADSHLQEFLEVGLIVVIPDLQQVIAEYRARFFFFFFFRPSDQTRQKTAFDPDSNALATQVSIFVQSYNIDKFPLCRFPFVADRKCGTDKWMISSLPSNTA
jgi:hypothetical protein